MGRSRWPPNSFTEWVVGQNFKDAPRRSSTQTKILNVALSEDEVSGDETIEITFNGRRSGSRAIRRQPPVEASQARRVRFDRDRRPLKSALKKTASSGSDSDTLVDESSEEKAATSEDESSAVEESDTSEEEAWANRKQRLLAMKKARAGATCKKKTDSEDVSEIEKSLPHPTCRCQECVRGRKIMETMVQFEAMQQVAKNATQSKSKQKGKGKGKNDETTSTETKSADATSDEATSAEASATDASEAVQTEDTEEDKKKTSPKQKNKKSSPKGNNKKSNPKQDEKPTPKEDKKASPKAADTPKPVNKDAFKLPTYPKSMEPNLIMPIRSKVLQCEHAIEGPSDPRPNAFIDSGKGIVRVYHGPTWGNPTAELYGKVNPEKLPSPLPPSARPYPDVHGYPPPPPGHYGPPPYGPFPPYPPYPPYPGPSPRFHNAGPPPGAPPAKNMFPGVPKGPSAMNAQIPQDAATKEAASNGVGLTGFAFPETPVLIREARAQEQQEKAKSEAANNVGPSQGGGGSNAWGKQPTPIAPMASPADGAGGNGGGGTGNDTWGKPAGDGTAQQIDFSAWGGNNGGFQRTSNKTSGGSQKSVQFAQPTWGGGGSGNAWDAAQGDTNGWAKSGNNFEKSPAVASHHASKPPSDQAAHGPPGGDGGGNGWGDQDAGKGGSQVWGAQRAANDGWNVTGQTDNVKKGLGSASHTVHDWVEDNANNAGGWNDAAEQPTRPSPTWGAGGNTWGGPPGSKPPSRNPSRHFSNDGRWGDTAGNDNNAGPGPMPGAWVENGRNQSHTPGRGTPGGWNQDSSNNNNDPSGWNQNHRKDNGGQSRRASPNERYVGAFDWPLGQGPPTGNGGNSGWNGKGANGGYKASPARGWNNGNGGNTPRGPPPGNGSNGWNNNGGYNAPRGSPAGGWKGASGGNGGWNGPPGPQPQRTPNQTGGGGWGGTNQHQSGGSGWNGHEKKRVSPVQPLNAGGGGRGGGGGWDDNPSNNAGPTNGAWANSDLAQDTGGKVDNW
ncbi:hypothetical protein VSDG_05956 [Cytospora chrysosperma]|uniref:Uncharacterized protein n=1 Tax=Cytospora chrysosperma TaxID=252740 RepID=A0A423VTQ9_CYTCH|nr:hypothetical protein VSDG_05956 [Valsa sordida]